MSNDPTVCNFARTFNTFITHAFNTCRVIWGAILIAVLNVRDTDRTIYVVTRPSPTRWCVHAKAKSSINV